jgi:hypothetical protein
MPGCCPRTVRSGRAPRHGYGTSSRITTVGWTRRGGRSAGAETGYEVARRLTWTSRGRAFDDLDLFNRSLAVNEPVAHLVVLADQGRVVAGETDGVVRYGVG